MANPLKSLFGRQKKKQLSDEELKHFDELKTQGLERVLGPMHSRVLHAIIPFAVGGTVDLYPFLQAVDGTASATMEVIEPDGTGPRSSRIGTYELVACTREKFPDDGAPITSMAGRVNRILTVMARYSRDAVLNPGETCELPGADKAHAICLVLDEWKKPGVDFTIGGQKHGLLLCIEIQRSEMEYAMAHGSKSLLGKLKEKGCYPYSDINRDPVA